MRKLFFNLVIMLAITLLISSCSTVKIEYANRKIVYPGIPSGKTKMKYEIGISAKNNFSINSISLENSIIDNYSLQNKQTQVFDNVKKNDFKAGNYILFFSSLNVYKKGEKNKMTIKVSQKNKKKTIPVIVQDKAPERKR